MTPDTGWTSFRDVFDRANMLGLDQTSTAASLLAQLSAGRLSAVARGSRRQWDYSEDTRSWIERLPRETEPLKVPGDTWKSVQEIDEDCTSYWGDGGPEKIDLESVFIDWISGTVTQVLYTTNWNLLKVEWHGLQISSAAFIQITGETKQHLLHLRRQSEAERVRFVVNAVTRKIGQEASCKQWFAMHPEEHGRDAYYTLYKQKYQEIHGTLPQRGRPRKFPD